MALDALVVEHASEVDESATGPPPRGRRGRWIVPLVVLALVATALGVVICDEVSTNRQFDRTHRSLEVTQAHIGVVRADLDRVRLQLDGVEVQVFLDNRALGQDATDLTSAQAQLVGTRSDVSQQTTVISDLQTCLGGVQEALNALAVADQNQAIDILNSVAPDCSGAVASGG